MDADRATEAQSVAGTPITVLFSGEDIAARITELSEAIRDTHPHRLLIVCILKGGFVFAADLIRGMHRVGLAPEIEFMLLASYGSGLKSSGSVRVSRDIEGDVRDRDVVIIDDILESGRTLAYAKRALTNRGARRVLTCVLLNKHVGRATPIVADFSGFDVDDRFVVGYGMDAGHKYRQLPFIGVLTS